MISDSAVGEELSPGSSYPWHLAGRQAMLRSCREIRRSEGVVGGASQGGGQLPRELAQGTFLGGLKGP